MRRGIILLSLGWGIMWVLFVTQFLHETKSNVSQWEQSTMATEVVLVSFPYKINGTNLLIEGMGIYEGPYLEDGSDTPVTDTAALRVINLSNQPVERGAVILQIDQQRYVFELYAIPPGGCVYVCESEKKEFTTNPVTACTGWAAEDVWHDTSGLLTITEVGMGTINITNLTDRELPYIQLLYKSYDKESGVYIGGICHTQDILSLEPGESRTVKPYRYVSGYSRVVTIKLD